MVLVLVLVGRVRVLGASLRFCIANVVRCGTHAFGQCASSRPACICGYITNPYTSFSSALFVHFVFYLLDPPQAYVYLPCLSTRVMLLCRLIGVMRMQIDYHPFTASS